jgi:calpain
LFEDPEFGPNEEDIFGSKSIYPSEPISGYPEPESLVWLRPSEISKKEKPMFMSGGAQANDVIQGYLGDCWFIGALSIIATNDEYLYNDININEIKNKSISDELAHKLTKGVYPKIFHFLEKFGMYVFRFFKNYQWVYVIIDDRIPCYSGDAQNPQIVFAKCHSRNEFWVPLIEKAYAKLHSNYWALVGGQLDDALVDMTGKVSEKLKVLTDKNLFNSKELTSKEELWKRLNEDLKNKSMLGCSIKKIGNASGEGKVYGKNKDFLGLFSGHAYGIMDLLDIGNNKILRIRNPWGSENPVEWNGPWSDNSYELIQNLEVLNKTIKSKWGNEAEQVHKEQYGIIYRYVKNLETSMKEGDFLENGTKNYQEERRIPTVLLNSNHI